MEPDGTRPDRPARVQVVDNWNELWEPAVALVESLGQRESLRLDDDGWMPARQVFLVATMAGRPVGFLVFRVQPVVGEGGSALGKDGRAVLEAVVDGVGVDGVHDEHVLGRQLREAAMHRALELRCERFRWDVVEVKA